MSKLTDTELIKQIKFEFEQELKQKIDIYKTVLSSPTWANTGSNYHLSCRREKELQIKYFEKVLIKNFPKNKK